jgi:hypothetical protein
VHSLGWILVTWGIHAGNASAYIHPTIFASQEACEIAWENKHWGTDIYNNPSLKHDCQELFDQNRWTRIPFSAK